MSTIPLNMYRPLIGAANRLVDVAMKGEEPSKVGETLLLLLADTYGMLDIIEKMNEVSALLGESEEVVLKAREKYTDPLGTAAVLMALVMVLPRMLRKVEPEKLKVLLDLALGNFGLACLEDSGLSEDDFLAILGLDEEVKDAIH